MIIVDRVLASLQDVDEHRIYLEEKSHVRSPIHLIKNGWRIEKANVKGIEHIAQLRTIWKELGNARATELFKAQHFLVGQALDFLINPVNNQPNREKILEYSRLFGSVKSNPRITLVEISIVDSTIFDGNHTAMAALHYARENDAELVLPVYVLTERD